MDRLENLVDTSDGFLMNAFRSFFTVENKVESSKMDSLYDKYDGLICNAVIFLLFILIFVGYHR